jgi:hypothetical protein
MSDYITSLVESTQERAAILEYDAALARSSAEQTALGAVIPSLRAIKLQHAQYGTTDEQVIMELAKQCGFRVMPGYVLPPRIEDNVLGMLGKFAELVMSREGSGA